MLEGGGFSVVDLGFDVEPMAFVNAAKENNADIIAGGQADSKIADAQAAHEKTLTALLSALAGANVIYGLGMLEAGVTFNLAQLVMDNDFADMVKWALNGIPVSDETLAVDLIHKVGPFNYYMTEEELGVHDFWKGMEDRQAVGAGVEYCNKGQLQYFYNCCIKNRTIKKRVMLEQLRL